MHDNLLYRTAEFLITTSIGSNELLYKGYKIGIALASYCSSLDEFEPTHICFEVPRDSDIAIFCVYKAMLPNSLPTDTELWDFFVLSNWLLKGKEYLTYSYLKKLCPYYCDLNGIQTAIDSIIDF